MIKTHLLESKMKEREVWYPELSEHMGISYVSLKKRMKGNVDFRLHEIVSIRDYLGISNEQINEIFFK